MGFLNSIGAVIGSVSNNAQKHDDFAETEEYVKALMNEVEKSKEEKIQHDRLRDAKRVESCMMEKSK